MEVLKLANEIEDRRKNEEERLALMHELHQGRTRELEEQVILRRSVPDEYPIKV